MAEIFVEKRKSTSRSVHALAVRTLGEALLGKPPNPFSVFCTGTSGCQLCSPFFVRDAVASYLTSSPIMS